MYTTTTTTATTTNNSNSNNNHHNDDNDNDNDNDHTNTFFFFLNRIMTIIDYILLYCAILYTTTTTTTATQWGRCIEASGSILAHLQSLNYHFQEVVVYRISLPRKTH